MAQAGAEDVDLAVGAARDAFVNGWSELRPSERAKYLFRIARILQERSRELAVAESLDGGKPIKESRDVDLPGAAHFFDSQLDRFLMRVSVGYPGRDAELTILDAHGDHDALADLGPVITASQVEGMAQAVRSVHVADPLRGYLVDLANATRRHAGVAIGMSPRATLALQRVARALAAMQGRSYVVPDDFKELAGPVLSHRLRSAPRLASRA